VLRKYHLCTICKDWI